MENPAEKNQEAVKANAELTDKELDDASGGAVDSFAPIDGVTGETDSISTITPTVTVPTPIQVPKSIVS